MIKRLKFSTRYRPKFVAEVAQRRKTTTTRLFDDKDLRVGDAVSVIVAETGEVLGCADIIALRTTTFESFLGNVADREGTWAMYEEYYQRSIPATAEVKELTLRLQAGACSMPED